MYLIRTAVVCIALALVPAAAAQAEEIESGNVHLKLNPALAKKLKQ